MKQHLKRDGFLCNTYFNHMLASLRGEGASVRFPLFSDDFTPTKMVIALKPAFPFWFILYCEKILYLWPEYFYVVLYLFSCT